MRCPRWSLQLWWTMLVTQRYIWEYMPLRERDNPFESAKANWDWRYYVIDVKQGWVQYAALRWYDEYKSDSEHMEKITREKSMADFMQYSRCTDLVYGEFELDPYY